MAAAGVPQHLLHFKTALSDEDFQTVLKHEDISREYHCSGGAVCNMGCNSKPKWTTTITFYSDCPFMEEVRAKIKQIDPNIIEEFTTGWISLEDRIKARKIAYKK